MTETSAMGDERLTETVARAIREAPMRATLRGVNVIDPTAPLTDGELNRGRAALAAIRNAGFAIVATEGEEFRAVAWAMSEVEEEDLPRRHSPPFQPLNSDDAECLLRAALRAATGVPMPTDPILPALTDDPRPGDHVETGAREDAEAYDDWLTALDEDVIQGEFGYEPGEFTVYSSYWRELYDQGLTPREAWQRALDGYANARAEREAEQQERWARIVSEDEAAVARYRAEHRHE